MRSDKGKAFVLRRAGKSYREISDELGVAKSTLSNWFQGVDFSKAIRAELTKQANKKSAQHLRDLNRVRGIALEVHYEQAEKEALKEMKLYRNIPLFTAAVATYWGEGDMASKNHIRMTNTDPRMLKIFYEFLLRICDADTSRISLALFIYKDLDEKKCKRYWTKQLGIKKFHKTQILPSRHPTKKLPFGVASIVLTDTYLKRKMTVWIDHLPEMVLNKAPK
jgi:transcriptional regulator with XRE-family HTH domain